MKKIISYTFIVYLLGLYQVLYSSTFFQKAVDLTNKAVDATKKATSETYKNISGVLSGDDTKSLKNEDQDSVKLDYEGLKIFFSSDDDLLKLVYDPTDLYSGELNKKLKELSETSPDEEKFRLMVDNIKKSFKDIKTEEYIDNYYDSIPDENTRDRLLYFAVEEAKDIITKRPDLLSEKSDWLEKEEKGTDTFIYKLIKYLQKEGIELDSKYRSYIKTSGRAADELSRMKAPNESPLYLLKIKVLKDMKENLPDYESIKDELEKTGRIDWIYDPLVLRIEKLKSFLNDPKTRYSKVQISDFRNMYNETIKPYFNSLEPTDYIFKDFGSSIPGDFYDRILYFSSYETNKLIKDIKDEVLFSSKHLDNNNLFHKKLINFLKDRVVDFTREYKTKLSNDVEAMNEVKKVSGDLKLSNNEKDLRIKVIKRLFDLTFTGASKKMFNATLSTVGNIFGLGSRKDKEKDEKVELELNKKEDELKSYENQISKDILLKQDEISRYIDAFDGNPKLEYDYKVENRNEASIKDNQAEKINDLKSKISNSKINYSEADLWEKGGFKGGKLGDGKASVENKFKVENERLNDLFKEQVENLNKVMNESIEDAKNKKKELVDAKIVELKELEKYVNVRLTEMNKDFEEKHKELDEKIKEVSDYFDSKISSLSDKSNLKKSLDQEKTLALDKLLKQRKKLKLSKDSQEKSFDNYINSKKNEIESHYFGQEEKIDLNSYEIKKMVENQNIKLSEEKRTAEDKLAAEKIKIVNETIKFDMEEQLKILDSEFNNIKVDQDGALNDFIKEYAIREKKFDSDLDVNLSNRVVISDAQFKKGFENRMLEINTVLDEERNSLSDKYLFENKDLTLNDIDSNIEYIKKEAGNINSLFDRLNRGLKKYSDEFLLTNKKDEINGLKEKLDKLLYEYKDFQVNAIKQFFNSKSKDLDEFKKRFNSISSNSDYKSLSSSGNIGSELNKKIDSQIEHLDGLRKKQERILSDQIEEKRKKIKSNYEDQIGALEVKVRAVDGLFIENKRILDEKKSEFNKLLEEKKNELDNFRKVVEEKEKQEKEKIERERLLEKERVENEEEIKREQTKSVNKIAAIFRGNKSRKEIKEKAEKEKEMEKILKEVEQIDEGEKRLDASKKAKEEWDKYSKKMDLNRERVSLVNDQLNEIYSGALKDFKDKNAYSEDDLRYDYEELIYDPYIFVDGSKYNLEYDFILDQNKKNFIKKEAERISKVRNQIDIRDLVFNTEIERLEYHPDDEYGKVISYSLQNARKIVEEEGDLWLDSDVSSPKENIMSLKLENPFKYRVVEFLIDYVKNNPITSNDIDRLSASVMNDNKLNQELVAAYMMQKKVSKIKKNGKNKILDDIAKGDEESEDDPPEENVSDTESFYSFPDNEEDGRRDYDFENLPERISDVDKKEIDSEIRDQEKAATKISSHFKGYKAKNEFKKFKEKKLEEQAQKEKIEKENMEIQKKEEELNKKPDAQREEKEKSSINNDIEKRKEAWSRKSREERADDRAKRKLKKKMGKRDAKIKKEERIEKEKFEKEELERQRQEELNRHKEIERVEKERLDGIAKEKVASGLGAAFKEKKARKELESLKKEKAKKEELERQKKEEELKLRVQKEELQNQKKNEPEVIQDKAIKEEGKKILDETKTVEDGKAAIEAKKQVSQHSNDKKQIANDDSQIIKEGAIKLNDIKEKYYKQYQENYSDAIAYPGYGASPGPSLEQIKKIEIHKDALIVPKDIISDKSTSPTIKLDKVQIESVENAKVSNEKVSIVNETENIASLKENRRVVSYNWNDKNKINSKVSADEDSKVSRNELFKIVYMFENNPDAARLFLDEYNEWLSKGKELVLYGQFVSPKREQLFNIFSMLSSLDSDQKKAIFAQYNVWKNELEYEPSVFSDSEEAVKLFFDGKEEQSNVVDNIVLSSHIKEILNKNLDLIFNPSLPLNEQRMNQIRDEDERTYIVIEGLVDAAKDIAENHMDDIVKGTQDYKKEASEDKREIYDAVTEKITEEVENVKVEEKEIYENPDTIESISKIQKIEQDDPLKSKILKAIIEDKEKVKSSDSNKSIDIKNKSDKKEKTSSKGFFGNMKDYAKSATSGVAAATSKVASVASTGASYTYTGVKKGALGAYSGAQDIYDSTKKKVANIFGFDSKGEIPAVRKDRDNLAEKTKVDFSQMDKILSTKDNISFDSSIDKKGVAKADSLLAPENEVSAFDVVVKEKEAEKKREEKKVEKKSEENEIDRFTEEIFAKKGNNVNSDEIINEFIKTKYPNVLESKKNEYKSLFESRFSDPIKKKISQLNDKSYSWKNPSLKDKYELNSGAVNKDVVAEEFQYQDFFKPSSKVESNQKKAVEDKAFKDNQKKVEKMVLIRPNKQKGTKKAKDIDGNSNSSIKKKIEMKKTQLSALKKVAAKFLSKKGRSAATVGSNNSAA
jgi:hypothetical protein